MRSGTAARRFAAPALVVMAVVVVAGVMAAGCGRGRRRDAQPREAAPAAAVAGAEDRTIVRHPAAARIVAIGDLHGDLAATRAALRLAGAIDAEDRWIGGALVVVQCGDQLDRGDGEREILALFDRLTREAARAGGLVIPLNGNHELMNVAGDFRYVTPGGFVAFGDEDGRRAAFAPGSALARLLAGRPIYAIVGDTLFVHGGVLPEHLDAGLERMDLEARAWLRGEQREPPAALIEQESPLWTRRYAPELEPGGGPPDCAAAKTVLARLGLSRMVVAHTVQPAGVNAACDGQVWRIDVGLAALYGGPLQVLEIQGGEAHLLGARTHDSQISP